MIHKHTSPLTVETEQAVNSFIQTHPHATIFQSPAYFHFYLTQPRFRPVYMISWNAAGNVDAILLAVVISESNGILRYFSSRCVIHGGPLIVNDRSDLLDGMLRQLNTTVKRTAIFTQFRNFRQWDDDAQTVFKNHGFLLRDRLNLIVSLSNEANVLRGFSESRRRQLKKAFQAGVTVRQANNLAEVQTLYSMLHQLYRNKVRKPLPNFTFFEAFFNQMVPAGNGIILLVFANETMIGGIVSPITPRHTISELYVCGLDKAFPSHHPSVVATWAAMDYGLKNGINSFDFMGLGKPGVNYGVRDFKIRFGGTQVNHGRYARRNNKILYGIAEFGYNILRTLKKI